MCCCFCFCFCFYAHTTYSFGLRQVLVSSHAATVLQIYSHILRYACICFPSGRMKRRSLVDSSSFFFASGPSHSAPTRPPCGDGAVCVCVLCLCWVFPAQIQYFCSPVRQLFFASRPWSCGLVACFLSAFEAFWFLVSSFSFFGWVVFGFNKPSRDRPPSCRYRGDSLL